VTAIGGGTSTAGPWDGEPSNSGNERLKPWKKNENSVKFAHFKHEQYVKYE
jgi:hypothetical protein